MTFRWVALIALWTLISGPILGVPTNPASTNPQIEKSGTPTIIKNVTRR